MWPEAQTRIPSPVTPRGNPRSSDSGEGRDRRRTRRPTAYPSGTRSLDGKALGPASAQPAKGGLEDRGGRDLPHHPVVDAATPPVAGGAGGGAGPAHAPRGGAAAPGGSDRP